MSLPLWEKCKWVIPEIVTEVWTTEPDDEVYPSTTVDPVLAPEKSAIEPETDSLDAPGTVINSVDTAEMNSSNQVKEGTTVLESEPVDASETVTDSAESLAVQLETNSSCEAEADAITTLDSTTEPEAGNADKAERDQQNDSKQLESTYDSATVPFDKPVQGFNDPLAVMPEPNPLFANEPNGVDPLKTTSSDAAVANPPLDNVETLTEPEPVFPVNKALNDKIYLYCGEIYKIPTDAIVVGQNESLNDRHDENSAIYSLAGPTMEAELFNLVPVQTGDSVITSGGQLPCEWVIHSVGPKYDEKYLTASDHALHSAYHSALVLAAEHKIADIVFGCLYLRRKKYPRFEAAHVALRTIRKFLQHTSSSHLSVRRLMLCVPSQEDYEIYSALLTAYFPRTASEAQNGRNLLPENLGNEWGQIVLADRLLTVSVGPKPLPKEVRETYLQTAAEEHRRAQESGANGVIIATRPNVTGTRMLPAVGESRASMAESGADRDAERLRRVQVEFSKMSREERLRRRFAAMVEDAETEDLSDIRGMDFIRLAGSDAVGRAVVYIRSCNLQLPSASSDPESAADRTERVLLFLMHIMEDLRCVPFVILYDAAPAPLVSGAGVDSSDGAVDEKLVQDIFDLFATRYKENLQQLYVLHASFALRMYIWIALPFLVTPFWSNYIVVSNFNALEKYMEVASLDLAPRKKMQTRTVPAVQVNTVPQPPQRTATAADV